MDGAGVELHPEYHVSAGAAVALVVALKLWGGGAEVTFTATDGGIKTSKRHKESFLMGGKKGNITEANFAFILILKHGNGSVMLWGGI